MKLTKQNFTLHNIKRAIIAYKRKLQIWLFSGKTAEFIFGYENSLKDFLDSPKHIKEQFIWRIEQVKSNPTGKQCMAKGECVHCGCSVPDLQLADDSCEGNCYPFMMDAETWANFKLLNRFEVDLFRKVVYKYI